MQTPLLREPECIHPLFEAQVERTPDAAAVRFEEEWLSYRELNARANQLARALRKLGVGPEVSAGICVERSLEMVVGLLGILKAGGAYVPLDPAFPKERLAFLLEDARLPVLLTQRRLLESLPAADREVVCLDAGWGAASQEAPRPPASSVTAGNLAYVIYTSGSTGKPKGVAVEHRQLVNYVSAIRERLRLPRGASFALISSFATDLGHTALFPALCTGGCLHIISSERASDGAALAEYFTRHPIDCLKIVPSHLEALLTIPQPERLLPRQRLILGGEAARPEWIARLQRMAPGCVIFNHYGPTETTVGVVTHEVEAGELAHAARIVPLGRPLANTRASVLDAHGRPVPVDIPGELYIGGRNVSRGYLHHPALTAERFTPDPFSGEPGARLYRTGDRVRRRPDGSLEFLGRCDDQVKVRGYRVELGEVEAALAQHPELREVAVLARERGPDAALRLVAYVAPCPERSPTVAGRKRYPLPNNLAVLHLNRNETDYMYREIFELQAYMRHGITLGDGDCIFDVGANIGLFTLFVSGACRKPRVYAFEPNPTLCEIAAGNAALYGIDARVFGCGLARAAGEAAFTSFQGFSLLSGFHADPEAEKRVVKTYILNQQPPGSAPMEELLSLAEELLDERFTARRSTVPVRTLSDVIAAEQVERIDLLKINVEKSELDVLAGIEEGDWEKIRQVVLEVDVPEHLNTILSLLRERGFTVAVEQDTLLKGTPLCYVYALRAGPREWTAGDRCAASPRASGSGPVATCRSPVAGESPWLTREELQRFAARKLPGYMVPSLFVFLERLPRLGNGKVDRRALPAPDRDRPASGTADAAPRTPLEERLAGIWAGLLGRDQVGVHDNFLSLGGHSLLAMRMMARVRDSFAVELPLRCLFEAPTVAGLAALIAGQMAAGEDDAAMARMVAAPEALPETDARSRPADRAL